MLLILLKGESFGKLEKNGSIDKSSGEEIILISGAGTWMTLYNLFVNTG